MSELYVKLEDLKDICRIYGPSYDCIMDEVIGVSGKDIAKTIPIDEMRALLEDRLRAFAIQIWTEDDIIAAFQIMGLKNPKDKLVKEVAEKAKNSLEDCSDNWGRLHAIIKEVMKKEALG